MKAMRKMMAVMLMVLAFAAAQTKSEAQSREKSDRKSAAIANHRKPTTSTSPTVKPSSGPSTRPVRPDVKPGGSTTKPSGPATKPSGPATKPSGPSTRPNAPSTRPSGPPPVGVRPGPKPGPRPGFKPGHVPMPPWPKPVIVVRPSYGSIIAANIASSLARSVVRAASRPVYITMPCSLSLTHSYVASDTEYYYQDGVFYVIDALGQYRTIVPPTGALVEYLPEDYTTFRIDSDMYYRVDDTVYTLTLIDGTPYFEVLGQLR